MLERLPFLLKTAEAAAGTTGGGGVEQAGPGSDLGTDPGTGPVVGPPPGRVPSMFWGDLRAGDAEVTARTIELCHEKGVQAFSLRHDGGGNGDVVSVRAEGAAEYEFEDVSASGVVTVCQ